MTADDRKNGTRMTRMEADKKVATDDTDFRDIRGNSQCSVKIRIQSV